ncbi:hypothetical protein ALC60_06796, partial [Trachymyrmex zeteki]
TAPSRCGYFAEPNIDFVLQRQISKILSFVCSRRSERAFQLNCKLKRIFYSSANFCFRQIYREAWENGKRTWHQDASEDRKKRWTSENCFETFPCSES